MFQPIDQQADRPVYLQVADQIRAAIQDGRLAPGDQLPSGAQLVDQFQTSMVTVRRAIAELQNSGLISGARGRGVFVRDLRPVVSLRRARLSRDGHRAFWADVQDQGRQSAVRTDIRWGTAPEDIAVMLQVDPGSKVLIRDRVMGVQGGPVLQLAVSYITPAAVEAAPRIAELDTGAGGFSARLEEAGYTLHHSELVAARMPTPEEAQQLGLPSGTPVIQLTRVTSDQKEQPVEVMVAVVSPQMELVYDID